MIWECIKKILFYPVLKVEEERTRCFVKICALTNYPYVDVEKACASYKIEQLKQLIQDIGTSNNTQLFNDFCEKVAHAEFVRRVNEL